jgi:hypothetical protein
MKTFGIKKKLPKIMLLSIIAVTSFFYKELICQNIKQPFLSTIHIETKIHQGLVINHHPEMWALTDGYFPSYEIGLARQTVGKNSEVYFRKYPRYGLTYRYTNFNGSPYLGEAHSAMAFVSLKVAKCNIVELNFRTSLGIAYLTKTFDYKYNYKNRAISTNWNASIGFELSSAWKLSKIAELSTGITMLHLSNGTIKTPNYGLNIPALEAGLSFKLNRVDVRYKIPETLILRKGKNNLRASFGMAYKEIIERWQEKFQVFTGDIVFTHFYNNVNRYIIGFDGAYDQSNKIIIESQGDTTDTWVDESKFGAIVGHEWVISRFAINFSVGTYIYNLNKSNALVYNKIGVIYFFHNNIFGGITLKSHYAKADFLSANLGISL